MLSNYFKYENGEIFRFKYNKWSLITRSNNGKYKLIKFNNTSISYHRLLWSLLRGEIPNKYQLDHINGIKDDNRIDNLRLVSIRENQQNRVKHRLGKLVGCSFDQNRNKWKSCIQIQGRNLSLGYYKTEQEAHNIYLNYLKKQLEELLNESNK